VGTADNRENGRCKGFEKTLSEASVAEFSTHVFILSSFQVGRNCVGEAADL